ncbi:MAG: phosphotransferase [Sandaracinaceae bacterium]|nr:phosphotransferase [Sandaracinaceae bacterium]
MSEAARAALARYGLDAARLEPITVGLINQTWRVDAPGGERFVLQRVNPIFTAAVNDDIEAITARVAQYGVLTPRLVHTVSGERCAQQPDGVYRLLTFIDGEVVSTLSDPARAASVARLVARFHAALEGFEHRFAFTRPGPHDTPRHLAFLKTTLAEHAAHPRFADVQPVAQAILSHGAALPVLGALPVRIIHGDLKVTNVMFVHGSHEALALLDLDTMAHDTLAAEMGDALRSWCNPLGESDPRAEAGRGALPRCDRSVRGGGRRHAHASKRRAALPAGLEIIALELASRFCADALRECYFGWDATRFGSRSEHNLVRARSQLSLAGSVRAQRASLAVSL